MNKQISTSAGIAIVAVVGLAVAAVVWFGQEPQTQVQPAQSMAGKVPASQSQTETNSQIASANDTANWKTYTDSKYKFSFDYPSAYQIKAGDSSKNTDSMGRFLTIDISPTKKGMEETKNELMVFVEEIPDLILGCGLTEPHCIPKGEYTTINGTKWYKFPNDPGDQEISYAVRKDKYEFGFVTYETDQSTRTVFDKIIHTFKFLK